MLICYHLGFACRIYDREVKDGLVLTTAGGEEYKVTALPMRDELFNRLVAVKGQKWEAY